MYRASIAIFKNAPDFEYEEVSRPVVSQVVFEAAQRVIVSKSCEFLKTKDGVYIVRYAEHGPYQAHVSDEWLPVYVARIEKWSSGGIKRSEMEAFEHQTPLNLDPQLVDAFAAEMPKTKNDGFDQQTIEKHSEIGEESNPSK